MGRKYVTAERIIMRDGLRCHYCDEYMNVYNSPTVAQQKDMKRFTFEHVVPKSLGGSYGLYNIVGACAQCNSDHGNDYLKCFCQFCQYARVKTELKEIA